MLFASNEKLTGQGKSCTFRRTWYSWRQQKANNKGCNCSLCYKTLWASQLLNAHKH